MQNLKYTKVLILTLKALDVYDKKRPKTKQNGEIETSKSLQDILIVNHDEIAIKITCYKKFFTHQNNFFFVFSVSEEYFSFLQYLKKFKYYFQKSNENVNVSLEESYILSIKSLLLLEYFLENFESKY